MALLYHWTLVTSRSILNTPELDHFWQRVFPEIAFQHSYLMHRILSIAALHVVYLRPENKRLRLREAAHHHAQALVGFRESINTLGQHNSDALFASAVLTWFYAFLSFGKLYDEDCEDANPAARTSRILGAEWIPLIRGVGAILTPVYEHVRVGRLNPMLTLTNWDETDPDTQPGPGDEKLLRLRDSWPSDGDADVYNETLFLLRKSNAWMGQFLGQRGGSVSQQESGYNRDWSGPFIWLFLVPEKYFTLQCQRQPLALVLFAHFGALLQCLDGYWWMQGCGRSVVGVVDECLGPYWSQWMDWPKMVVGLS